MHFEMCQQKTPLEFFTWNGGLAYRNTSLHLSLVSPLKPASQSPLRHCDSESTDTLPAQPWSLGPDSPGIIQNLSPDSPGHLQTAYRSLLTNCLHCLQDSITSLLQMCKWCLDLPPQVCTTQERETGLFRFQSHFREDQIWGQLKWNRECYEEKFWTVKHREIFL